LQVPVSSEDWAAAEVTARLLASIVDKGNRTECADRPRDVEDYFSVPAGTP
jgi:hypothetical protein